VGEQVKEERLPISQIHPNPANLRLHQDRSIESIKASLRRFGQALPIVVTRDGVVRAGNGTYAAAKALGWTEIDVVWSDLEGTDAVAYEIADNRTAELAEWDTSALALQLASFEDDLELFGATGFTPEELEALQPPAPPPDVPQRLFFTLVFDSMAQQSRWFAFVRHLNIKMADERTLAQRVDRYLVEGKFIAA
jgi:hypothetical protein